MTNQPNEAIEQVEKRISSSRPWFLRFSLRALLGLVTLCCYGLKWREVWQIRSAAHAIVVQQETDEAFDEMERGRFAMEAVEGVTAVYAGSTKHSLARVIDDLSEAKMSGGDVPEFWTPAFRSKAIAFAEEKVRLVYAAGVNPYGVEEARQALSLSGLTFDDVDSLGTPYVINGLLSSAQQSMCSAQVPSDEWPENTFVFPKVCISHMDEAIEIANALRRAGDPILTRESIGFSDTDVATVLCTSHLRVADHYMPSFQYCIEQCSDSSLSPDKRRLRQEQAQKLLHSAEELLGNMQQALDEAAITIEDTDFEEEWSQLHDVTEKLRHSAQHQE